MFKINLRKIKNIKFSEREIDILSCILHLRGAKKIANILQISYRTVERHIQNIMLKISCNSQESIKDFIESSDNHLHIKKHYTSLLIDAFFQNQLLKIANHAKRKKLTFDILNQDKFKQASKKIIKHLELAGLTKDCNDAKIQITIQQKESPKTSDCVLSLEKYYINFFEIVAKHISDINFSNFIDEFEKLSKNTNEVRTDLTNQLVNNIQNNIDLSITKTKYKFSRKYLLIGITATCLILSGFILRYFLTGDPPSTIIISSNLHVPHASNHLERPNILNDLRKKILASKDSIKIFTLAGIAGSGKTTIAHQYARASNASTIWEINCASEEEILASFEDLAQELCISTKCRDELKFIQNANTDKQRQKLLSVFISKKLGARPNWLLIFDNVETTRQIKPYLPNNPKIWGNGTIIITTRNTNNVVNNYIDENNVIILEALKPNERLNLFKKIATNTQEDDSSISKFLNKIPPYPLDISIAAYYLKEHNTPFVDYINNIKTLPLSFVDAQKNTLRDMGEYTDTRYGIITLSIHKILEKNPGFTELMLYISLINSTDIPQNMLLENHDPIITNNFIHELKKHSLIQEQHPNFLQLHKSTQQIILDFLVNKESILTNNKTTETIISNFYQFTMNSLEDDNIELIRILTTHAEKLHDHSNLLNTESTALLNITLGNCYFYLSNNNKAKNFFEKGIQNINNNIALASAQIMLGNVYTNIGEYEQAEIIFKKAIQSFSQAYSPDDYHVAWSKVSLGRLYIKIGKYTNARTLLTEAYHTYKDYYGQNHPETAWVMLYLGNLLTEAGIFAEAENILSTSLNINKQHYGTKHIEL